eukprot:s2564_g17.t1
MTPTFTPSPSTSPVLLGTNFGLNGLGSEVKIIISHHQRLEVEPWQLRSVPLAFQENPRGIVSRREPENFILFWQVIQEQTSEQPVTEANGLEVWRQLHTLHPKTKGRSLALLNALMPVFAKDRSCHEQVQGMERLAEEYRKASGHDERGHSFVSLIRVSPKYLQQHVQLTNSEHSSFAEVKEHILAFERISSTRTKDRVLAYASIAPLGAVTWCATSRFWRHSVQR